MVVLGILALVISIVALVIAITKKPAEKVVEKEVVKVVYAPVEHPFVYDEKNKTYTLDGDLLVSGDVTCAVVNEK